MLNSLVLKDGSVARIIVTPFGQEEYYVFLIYSQGKHLHFQAKGQEKSGKSIRQDVYEPYYCLFV